MSGAEPSGFVTDFMVAHTNALRDALEFANLLHRRAYALALEATYCFERRGIHERDCATAVTIEVAIQRELDFYREELAEACAPWFEAPQPDHRPPTCICGFDSEAPHLCGVDA